MSAASSRPEQDAPAKLVASVPANILVAGEYAVLEEGGLGFTLAVEARARASWSPEPAHGLRIQGSPGSGTLAYPGDDPFLNRLVPAITAIIAERANGRAPAGTIRVDTSEFYHPDGTKRGFGSSAAATVLITALLLGPDTAPADIARAAVTAHRAGQGGRGSGYDVWTSALGGAALFTGGGIPEARRVAPAWLGTGPVPTDGSRSDAPPTFAGFPPLISLFAGPQAVRTPGAVHRYEAWKERHPDEAREFAERSNALVAQIAAAANAAEAGACIAACRANGTRLGSDIGVPADLELRGDLAGNLVAPDAWKAVGAGNELGVAFTRGGDTGAGAYQIAQEGLLWE